MKAGFGIGLLLPFIFQMILGFGSAQYRDGTRANTQPDMVEDVVNKAKDAVSGSHNGGQADFTAEGQVRAAQHNDPGNAASVDDLGCGLGQDGGKVRNADKGRLDCNNDQQQCANDKIQRIVVEPIHNFFGFQH